MDEVTAKFDAALAEAQSEMGQPKKDKTARVKTKQGYTYEYQYSSLAEILKVIRPPLNKRGISVGQRTVMHDSFGPCIETYARFGGEERILDHEPYSPNSNDPKTGGANTTYAKRYSLCKAFCVEGVEDTDVAGIANDASYTPVRKPTLTDAQREELRQLTARMVSLGRDEAEEKRTIFNAFKDGGIDAARTYVELAMPKMDLADEDLEF